jgi:hypothetical protein
VEALESLMPIIAKSAPSRRIGMVAQKLSICGALRQIYKCKKYGFKKR